jgi:oxygen-dependent protoporphyrinogen oxidase
MSDVEVLVVGGGISGLATAWWLSRLGVDVEVWEASARAGGKIRTQRAQGFVTEEAAALVMRFRPEVDGLVDRLGLAGAKLGRSPAANRYLVTDGKLAAVPMRLGAMIASPLWSWRGKLRLLAEPFVGRGCRDDESVTEFVTRRLGREVLERAMEPYVAGPLASDPDLAEARSVLPRLTALERRYGSLTAGVLSHQAMRRRTACAAEGFSFRRGMSTLVDALAGDLGSRVRLALEVDAVEPRNGGWRVEARSASGCAAVNARHVVLCVPADSSARTLAPIDGELSDLLHGIAYAPVGVVHLGFASEEVTHPLDGTGFLVPRSEGGALTGCLWASSLFSGRAAPGRALVTCYIGGARLPQAIEWDDDRTVSTVLGELHGLLGLRSDPVLVRIHRHPRALPLYHGAHQARLEAIDRRLRALPGLHLEGNYRGGVSVQDRIAGGRAVAARIVAESATVRAPVADTRAARATPAALAARPATGV